MSGRACRQFGPGRVNGADSNRPFRVPNSRQFGIIVLPEVSETLLIQQQIRA